MGVKDHVVHLLEVGPVEREGLWASERNPAVALQRFGEDHAAGFLQDQAVEARVHLRIRCLIALLEAALAQQFIAVVQTGAQLTDERLRGALFGDTTSGESFEDAAGIDRVQDVARSERSHDIAARPVLGQKTFLGEQWERLAHGRSRHPELFGDGGFGHSLPGHELAAQDHLAQPHDRFG